MKATLKNYRQAPRKVSLISNLINGKSVKDSRNILSKLIKRGSKPILKLLDSAIANAKENNKTSNVETYKVYSSVSKGVVLKRWQPRAMGRAFPIHKHNSHIKIELKEKSASGETK